MNKTQMNQFNMMKSVDKFFTNHQSLVSTNPAIVAAVNKLKSLISDINSLSNVQAVNTKADSAIKAEVKKRLINTALKVAGGLSAQAAATGDARLKQAADITLSELNVMREADLLIKIRTIHEAALPIATELAVWGVVHRWRGGDFTRDAARIAVARQFCRYLVSLLRADGLYLCRFAAHACQKYPEHARPSRAEYYLAALSRDLRFSRAGDPRAAHERR